MFTKEHYIAVAKVLRHSKNLLVSRGEHALFVVTLDNFIALFRENLKFSEVAFLDEVYGSDVSD